MVCETNSPCLTRMELLEKYFIFIKPGFLRLEN